MQRDVALVQRTETWLSFGRAGAEVVQKGVVEREHAFAGN